ncbi:TetR/AcrR family transcriptional regulator C-terminal domain-containing protein [Kutzneria sp. CA-103260]|uniref:TetR/AcrR family transcriptional regulator C-terminal domain-containing protein n=1 Tax=Kutzneria sp. CA-103260 TaxID=2802641 RepID=UPI001BACBF11|nr:TetR/AcrR family transcriptional regulator C-terminal domain-containing protein [Kutzneria sp. CA-103260]QUQ66956.1 transcriptional regulator [Kutzneria sp. CA-103260]
MRINREQVLAAALDLLDEAGLDQLSMRRLATALGVQNGATYWHFRSKQALLEAMADELLAGVADVTELPWEARVTELATRLRRALLARRDGARVFSGVFFPLPNALAYGNALIGALLEAGLSPKDAAWTADTVTYHVVAHTIEEQLAAEGPDRLEAAVDPVRHPHLHAALAHVPSPHPEQHFHHGLRLIVAGIRAEVAATAPDR